MKIRTVFYLFIFLLYLTACGNSTEEIEKNHLSKSIAQIEVGDQYKWLVILPGVGCHGCIQDAEYFMKKNVANKKILFVLTNVSSLKILQQKTEIRIDEHSNIFIDQEGLFRIPTDNAIYPCVVELNNGSIQKHMFQSPQTAAFFQLQQHLE